VRRFLKEKNRRRSDCETHRVMRSDSTGLECGHAAHYDRPEAAVKDYLKPSVLVDAILAKRNVGTKITDAP